MPDRRLPTSILAALGLLGASCRGCDDEPARPCLSMPPEHPVPPPDEPPAGPCLRIPADGAGTIPEVPEPPVHPCLEYAPSPADPPTAPPEPPTRPCLDFPVGPCLSEPPRPPEPPPEPPEPPLRPCLSPPPPPNRPPPREEAAEPPRKCLTHLDVCLSAHEVEGTTSQGAAEPPGPRDATAALDAVLARGVLPEDIAARLRARRPPA